MEIILNHNMCKSFTGRFCPLRIWHIRCIHGRFFTVCRSKNKEVWRLTLPNAYNALREYLDIGLFWEIILNEKEKEVLGL